MSDGAPASFGRFDLLGEIGQGAMGVVFEAVQRDLGRRVALKLLPRERLSEPGRVDALLQEARAAAAVRHPGLVEVYDAGVLDGQPYLAMELVDGHDLEHRLARSPFELRDAVRLVAEIATAIDALHAHQIVHRDLKPSNVMIDSAGRSRVSDFGLAHVVGGDGQHGIDALAGTPGWMAPEQIDPRIGPIGPAADVWALGALLFRLLAGRGPIVGANTVDLVLATIERPPLDLRAVAPAVPRELAAIVGHCIARNPDDRYQRAGDLASDLARWLRAEALSIAVPGFAAQLVNWSRRHLALAAHLIAIAIAWTIAALDYFVFDVTDLAFFGPTTTLAVVAAVAGCAFDRSLRLDRRPRTIAALWTWTDAAAIAAVAMLGDGPSSAVVQVLPVLVAMSALWQSERTVVSGTLAAVAVHVLLAVHAAAVDSPFRRPVATTLIAIASQLLVGAIVLRIVRHARLVADLAGRRQRD